ncbi:MAG: hypothetical protein GSR80_000538 [Desulfurococcales archaeon]|nr:hypothetical protein [Desulfurococcales archaeon]
MVDKLALTGRDLNLAAQIPRGINSIAGATFKHAFLNSAIERLAHAMLNKLSSIISNAGGKIYSKYSYTAEDEKAVAVLKYSAPWGTPAYRVVVVVGSALSKRGLRGWVRMHSYIMYYLVVPEAMHSRLDFIKPRIKRAVPANGVVAAATYPAEAGVHKPETLKCYGASGVLREYRSRYIVFIPPIIAWRFSRWIHFDPHYTYELEGCRSIEEAVAQ